VGVLDFHPITPCASGHFGKEFIKISRFYYISRPTSSKRDTDNIKTLILERHVQAKNDYGVKEYCA
jgi:hypothetical protein